MAARAWRTRRLRRQLQTAVRRAQRSVDGQAELTLDGERMMVLTLERHQQLLAPLQQVHRSLTGNAEQPDVMRRALADALADVLVRYGQPVPPARTFELRRPRRVRTSVPVRRPSAVASQR